FSGQPSEPRPAAFRPIGQDDLAPPGTTAKLRANLDALATLRRCREEERWANADEQRVLARWSGWGAIPQVFDESNDRFTTERAELRRLLATEEAWAQARRTTLN